MQVGRLLQQGSRDTVPRHPRHILQTIAQDATKLRGRQSADKHPSQGDVGEVDAEDHGTAAVQARERDVLVPKRVQRVFQ